MPEDDPTIPGDVEVAVGVILLRMVFGRQEFGNKSCEK
jgi:hypothetical protein